MTEDWTAIHAAMAADKGEDWKICDRANELYTDFPQSLAREAASLFADNWREAMHDRDRLHRERDYEREELGELRRQIADETWNALN